MWDVEPTPAEDDAGLLCIALLSNAVGLAWLALAMDAHWRQVRGTQPRTTGSVILLRLLGLLALALSLLLCLQVDHVSMAVLVWVMSLAAAALSVAFTLAWRPRWLALVILGAGTPERTTEVTSL